MTVLTEGNLQLTIGGAAKARKFDDASHGLSFRSLGTLCHRVSALMVALDRASFAQV